MELTMLYPSQENYLRGASLSYTLSDSSKPRWLTVKIKQYIKTRLLKINNLLAVLEQLNMKRKS